MGAQAEIAQAAKRIGFSRIGFASAEPFLRGEEALRAWLDENFQGTMGYMREHPRHDPRIVFDAAKTLLVVALPYQARLPTLNDGEGRIARYALGRDYHLLLKEKLNALAHEAERILGPGTQSRVCVDTAPLLEREVLMRSGLGFIAKNTMAIVPGVGSYTVLGVLALNRVVESPAPEASSKCGTCRACLEACPTGAFVDEFVLDARRCISYLTIEHRGSIPEALRKGIGDRIFGCDVCQEVCPFNVHAASPAEDFGPPRAFPALRELLLQRSGDYRRFVRGSAMTRTSRHQLARNAAIAMGNSGDPKHLPDLQRYLNEYGNPMVREHVEWAIREIAQRSNSATTGA